jgi:uncharacterized protein with NRDE domain
MCLILFAWRAHPDYSLLVAANRDEHHDRPAAPAACWDDYPQICGGRDLLQGGSWMAVTRDGRFAAVTNFRQGLPGPAAPRSRGHLVSGFLLSGLSPEAYLASLLPQAQDYNPFSLIAGDAESLWYYSNQQSDPVPVEPGVHGLSNHLLDTPWPKVTRSKAVLQESLTVSNEDARDARLFAMLADRSESADHELPDTGIPYPREKALSPAFITGDRYGTRSSTVLTIGTAGGITLRERRFAPLGLMQGETVISPEGQLSESA